MKKLIVLSLLLCVVLPLKAQYRRIEIDISRDLQTHPSWEELQSISCALSDTLSVPLMYYSAPWRKWCETPQPGGGMELRFCLTSQREDLYSRRENYCFPLTVWCSLSDGIHFESDWSIGLPRPQSSGGIDYASNNIYIRQDTVITIIGPTNAGSISPEGQTFRFVGSDVEHITARTKWVYSVSECIFDNELERLSIQIGKVNSQWMDCQVDKYSYRLPVADKIVIDAKEFEQLKSHAIAIQQQVLLAKRDSVSAVKLSLDSAAEPLDEWQARHRSDIESASTFRELEFDFWLDHLLTEVTVFLRGGEQRRFVHWAGYEGYIPPNYDPRSQIQSP